MHAVTERSVVRGSPQRHYHAFPVQSAILTTTTLSAQRGAAHLCNCLLSSTITFSIAFFSFLLLGDSISADTGSRFFASFSFSASSAAWEQNMNAENIISIHWIRREKVQLRQCTVCRSYLQFLLFRLGAHCLYWARGCTCGTTITRFTAHAQ